MLIAVLAAVAGATEPTDGDILFCQRCNLPLFITLQNRNGYGAGVYAAAFFRGRNALNSMTSGFVRQTTKVFAGNLDEKGAKGRGVSSFWQLPGAGRPA